MGTRRTAGRGKDSRYLYLYLGNVLSSDLAFRNPEHKCNVMVGTGTERGQIAVELHDTTGTFTARRQKDGSYKITMREAAVAGRLNTDFEEFTVEEADKIHGNSAPGHAPKPKMVMFRTGIGVLCALPNGRF
jgi:hypothetical protein